MLFCGPYPHDRASSCIGNDRVENKAAVFLPIPLFQSAWNFIIADYPIRTYPYQASVMPKQKTHKGTKKRFRVTANGKVKHRSAGTSHLQSRMSQKRKRNLRGTSVVDKTEFKRIIAALHGNSY